MQRNLPDVQPDDWTDEPPPPSMLVFLEPGALHCAERPTIISTILGSCVSVCLWDPRLRLGGMNHYMLPTADGRSLPSPRYGDVAIDQLMQEMTSRGCRREQLVAKLFGGAEVLPTGSTKETIGQQNIRQAMSCLKAYRIAVVAKRTGGTRGLSVKFNTDTGEVLVRLVGRPPDRT
jgi:chemotaxis protein CheD